MISKRTITTFLLPATLLCSLSAKDEPAVDKPLPPEEAASTMELPEGFRATLFASEPEVVQPINFCVDDRGRLWVCEAVNYPKHGLTPGDRIVIFEDEDNDGKFDKRTVFYDQLNYVTGIEVGFGGVWVMSPPYFYFIPDKNGDDVPDDEPEVVLDGFGNHANSHNLANGFAWGPDGWLYATHGRTNWSMIGKPGTPEMERERFDGGVWRMDPLTREWEPWSDGTTNPWGIDWDDYGQAFITNCVNPHLFHAIPGAHYEPWRGRKSSQYAYERIETIADHLHYEEGRNVREHLLTQKTHDLGGGHAHCGVLVYLGDSFPDRYRNTVFMNNIHGKRINNDILERSGSGYTADHGRDLMISKDPWFMGATLQAAPDGSIYVIDWSDTGECHSTRNTQKGTGRIFKISYGETQEPDLNWESKSNVDLARLQSSRNEWMVRHARRILQERTRAGQEMAEAKAQLLDQFHTAPNVPARLRALWTLHAMGLADDAFLKFCLGNRSQHIRAWAVRLLCERETPDHTTLQSFRFGSLLERLEIASSLQRIDTNDPEWRKQNELPEEADEKTDPKWRMLVKLSRDDESTYDQNLPHMIWYAGEPMIHDSIERFLKWGAFSKIPLISRNVARRVAEFTEDESRMEKLVATMATLVSVESKAAFLEGTLLGLEGSPALTMPESWPDLFAKFSKSRKQEIRERSIRLALKFNDPTAIKSLKKTVIDGDAEIGDRRLAIAALASYGKVPIADLLIQVSREPELQANAIRAMSSQNDKQIPDYLLESFGEFPSGSKQDALQTLASRAKWGQQLLDAVEDKRIPLSEISTYTARQLKESGDKELAARVDKLWGTLRKLPAEKKKLFEEYLEKFTPKLISESDPSKGRQHFQLLCAGCHQMFGEGGTVGPELTGSQRTNLDYILENLIDPSAAVSKDYQLSIIETTSGRIVAGVITSETDTTVKVKSINEEIALSVSEIKKRTRSPVSMMPEGLLQTLSTEQALELIAYLSSPRQVAVPAQ